MIIYLCMKHESNILIFSKDTEQKPFSKLKKGHNSHKNWLILPLNRTWPTLIIYLCIKYESKTLIFSKDIEGKRFSKLEKGHNSHNVGGFYPKSNLTLYFMITIYLCIKYESNTLIFTKDI